LPPTGPDLEIRTAVPADVPSVERVTREAYAVHIPAIGREPAPMAADHAGLVAAGEVRVAVIGERIAGVLVTRPQQRSLLLESVAVDPRLQGRGIGRALIADAEAQAAGLGLDAVELYTNAAMADNLALYPRLGYEQVERRIEHGYDRVFFRKEV
jgi:ribosomal protein S18 acetylase RimI-like enzyme